MGSGAGRAVGDVAGIMLNSQWTPLKLPSQTHSNESFRFSHKAPFWHGDEAQLSDEVSQS